MGRVLSRSHGRLALVLCLTLTALFALGAATTASAAPSDPVISTTDLQTLITGGTVDGYFKTVISGETIIDIPVHVLAVVPNSGLNGTALIMFEAYGLEIDKIGGIAAGMSGSPLYVDDAGTDKLAGAVSYGDIFTTGGLGLATPIQAMIDIEEGYDLVHSSLLSSSVSTTRLAEPVVSAASGTITRLAVADSAKAARAVDAAAGTVVLAPLAVVEVGGLRSNSHAYEFLVKKFAAVGIELRLGTSAAGSSPDFETPVVGGASVADMLMSGDLWVGAVGTVTYTNGDNVVAFGHPFDWAGDVETELANAWVLGVWSSTLEPYKMVVPGKTRGAFTQDRANGVAGTLSYIPETVPVTCAATMVGTTRTAATSSKIPSWAFNEGDYWWLPEYGVFDIFAREADSYNFYGTATTTTTIVVNDGTQDLVLTRNNMFSGSGWWDTPDYAAAWELDDMVYYLMNSPDGLVPATIKSVDFQTNLDPVRRAARIVDMSVPGGLKVGDNLIHVALREHANPTLINVDVPLTIAPGELHAGSLEVSSADSYWYEDSSDGSSHADGSPPTVAEKIANIAGWPQNNDITATYSVDDRRMGPVPTEPQADIIGTYRDTRSLSGYQYRETSRLVLRANRSRVPAGSPVTLSGAVLDLGPSSVDPATPIMIDIYRRAQHAAAYTFVRAVPLNVYRGTGYFRCRIASLRRSTTFKAVWSGDDRYLGATAFRSVAVTR